MQRTQRKSRKGRRGKQATATTKAAERPHLLEKSIWQLGPRREPEAEDGADGGVGEVLLGDVELRREYEVEAERDEEDGDA